MRRWCSVQQRDDGYFFWEYYDHLTGRYHRSEDLIFEKIEAWKALARDIEKSFKDLDYRYTQCCKTIDKVKGALHEAK